MKDIGSIKTEPANEVPQLAQSPSQPVHPVVPVAQSLQQPETATTKEVTTEETTERFTIACLASKECKDSKELIAEQIEEKEREKLLQCVKETGTTNQIDYEHDSLYENTKKIVKNCCSEETMKGERNIHSDEEKLDSENEEKEDVGQGEEKERELEEEADSKSEHREGNHSILQKTECIAWKMLEYVNLNNFGNYTRDGMERP